MKPQTIACIGGCHVDVKAVAAGSVVFGTSNPVTVTRTPGGVACNVARWLARFEVPVELHSVVGDDAMGHDLVERLEAEGIGVEGIDVVDGETTATYTALLDGSGSLAVGIADMDIYHRLDRSWGAGVVTATSASYLLADANVSTDALVAIAGGRGDRWLGVDPVSVEKARRVAPMLDRLDAVFPDAAEASVLGGTVDDAAAAAAAIAAAGTGTAVVTLGASGVVTAGRSGTAIRPAVVPDVVADVTGAGDALVAGYLFALVTGEADPIAWGLAAASLAVETRDTVPDGVTVDAVRVRLP